MSQPAYIMARIQVRDFEAYFERYGLPLLEVVKAFDGEFLSATTDGEVLEGHSPANWTVLARFPTMEAARAFYDSAQYAPLKALRMNELSDGGTLVLFPENKPA